MNGAGSVFGVFSGIVKFIIATRLIIDVLILALIVYLIYKFLDLCKTVNEISKRNKEQAELLKQQNETLVKLGQIMIKINQDKEE